jgi:hypothetical protein
MGQAGLVGWRGRLGRKVADKVGNRTRLDAETIAAAIGAYLFISRARRMVQMVRRMKRGETR